jgi:hypothetical protein
VKVWAAIVVLFGVALGAILVDELSQGVNTGVPVQAEVPVQATNTASAAAF